MNDWNAALKSFCKTKEDVDSFSSLLEQFQLQNVCELPHEDANWLSSFKEPFSYQSKIKNM